MLVPTGTTTTNHGSCQLSKRCVERLHGLVASRHVGRHSFRFITRSGLTSGKNGELIRCIFFPLKATSILLNDETLDHEYLPITGLPEFTSAAAKLILGSDSAALKEGRAISVQTISGTGANHLGALFLSRFYNWNGPKKVYLSNPTWGDYLLLLSLEEWVELIIRRL